ncbi:MAG: diguanylate cyclase [Methylococcaceae bacterium]|nr:diguanylate cyclase [Methylococcaceae bacterium]
MAKPSDDRPVRDEWEEQRNRIIGLGESSFRKSYYPALRRNIADLKSLLLAVEQTTSGIFICTRNGHIEFVNAALSDLTGYRQDELIGQTPLMFWATAADGERFEDVMQGLLAGNSWRGDILQRNRSGKDYWAQVSVAPIRDDTGEITHFVGIFEDISTRKQTEEELERRVLERTRHLVDALNFTQTILLNSPLPMGVYAATGACITANEAYARLVGGTQQALMAQNFNDIAAWTDTGLLDDVLGALADRSPRQREIRVRSSFHQSVWLDCRVFPVQLNGEPHVLIQFIDLTERKSIEDKLRLSAFHDELTQLPNRRLLLDRLEQAMLNSKRHNSHLAVLFLDLNRFKQLNDTHGHHVGDQMLMEVALRLRQTVRECDTVARLGGDEFVVLLEGLGPNPDLAEHHAAAIADKIRRKLATEYRWGEIRHQGSASLGVVLFLAETLSPVEVLRAADAAMYESKRANLGRCLAS